MVRDLLIKDRRLHNRETLVAKIPSLKNVASLVQTQICRYKILRLRETIKRKKKYLFIFIIERSLVQLHRAER